MLPDPARTISFPARSRRAPRAGAGAPARAAQGPRQADQPRAAGRRRPWRLHLGRARPAARRRPDRDRRHLRRLGRSGERGHAGRRARPRRAGRGAAAARRLLARGERRRPLARPAARRGRAAVPLRAAASGLWFGAMSRMLSPYDLNPLNINPLKDLIERFVDFEAIRGDPRPRAVHFRHQRPHRRAARVHARGNHAGGGDGLGLPAAAVPRGGDRRRALLGRRLQRQSRRSFRSCARPRPRTC